jgi:hypothetical protein
MFGYGLMTFQNGTLFEGLFLNNSFNIGQGVKIFTGSNYTGKLKKTMMHG